MHLGNWPEKFKFRLLFPHSQFQCCATEGEAGGGVGIWLGGGGWGLKKNYINTNRDRIVKYFFLYFFYVLLFYIYSIWYTGELTKRVREMSSQLFITPYTLSIYLSAHKQLIRQLPNPLREFLCITSIHWALL